ncbi:fibrinogen C-terminal domain-containing protein [Trichonephila inaurata madagascariensis]|uniref:Fibrinogen C-terminal domain-containing protein n=1 Tax=Trichonephila inaurata madagascariensis TaxID=2747483 RepID=A0A8X6IMC5_9ARAC|nr:fibrinogen C-terminal domain-containing protein [Trichonephila inaurata madagascariensis]
MIFREAYLRLKGGGTGMSENLCIRFLIFIEETVQGSCPSRPIDCEELLQCGLNQSGIYRIYPRSRVNTWGDAGFDVYCDMDTDGGGWTVG